MTAHHVSNGTTIDPLIGTTIRQYDIVAKLGGGGMGVVYKATDTKLGRAVALKFLPPQWSNDDGAKQRFLREAQAASSTNHRNICVIHDIEQTDDGRLFIVMAYYEGQTLKQKLEKGGAVPAADALEIATEVAEGLAKAHAQGVVHRDIKPGNLIITDDGVKVLDFGLAKFADALQLTMPGSTIGTVAYMAPEQVRGEEVDGRSDVWSLGVVLYEMLTGEVPFKGTYAEATFHAIKNEPLPPLRVLERGVPAALEALVRRALEKDPGKRYQTARELARDLRLIQGRSIPDDLRTEPLPALPTPAPPSRWQRMRRAVTPARAIVAAVVLAGVGFGAYRWLMRPVSRISVAIVPVANFTGEQELDPYRLALTESLIEELGESSSIRVVSYRRLLEIIRRFLDSGNVSNSEAIQAIAATTDTRLIVVPTLVNRGEAWQATAEIRNAETGTSVAKYETAAITSSLPKDAVYRLMEPLANKIREHVGPGGALDPVLVLFHASLASRQRLHDLVYGRESAPNRFRTVEAARAFEQGLNAYDQMEYASALEAFRRAASLDDQHAMTHAWLSRIWLILNQRNQAAEAAKRAKQLAGAGTPAPDAAFIEGIAAESRVDFVEANRLYRRLVTLEPDNPSAHTELADFLKRRDRSQEAVETFHAVLRLAPGYVRPHLDLCQLYAGGAGSLPLAEQHGQTALKNYHAAGNRGGEAQALLCLAEARRRQGGERLREAKRNVAEARSIFESLTQPYNVSRALNYQGTVEYNDGNFREAARFYEEAVSRSQAVGNRLIEGLALMNLGGMFYKLGQRSEAIVRYEQSRDVFADMGDERRAAETTINAANVQIDYGSDQSDAVRRLASARAMARQLGYVGFEVLAMQGLASSDRNAGRLTEARKQFVAALNMARDKQLADRVSSLTVEIAESDLMLANYETARRSLEDFVARDTERKNLKARITLGKVHLRLGDRDAAKKDLETVSEDIESQRLPEVAPLTYAALGETAYDSGNFKAARAQYDRASVLWTTDELPDAASVEARSYIALLDGGKVPAAAEKAKSSVVQAKRMGRLALEARCRVNLARIYLQQRRYSDAVATLADIPLGEGEPTIGTELQAQVRYWRSLALAGRGDQTAADQEAALARTLAQQIQKSLPAPFHTSFMSRLDIRPIFDPRAVR